MRVLIVEDQWLLAAHVADIVRENGHEVVAMARRQDKALSAAAAHHHDLAIMDLQLLDGDCGVEVARQLKEQFGLRSLFLSGNIQKKAEEIRSLDLLPLAMLQKPISDAVLAAALADAERELGSLTAGEAVVPEQAAAEPAKD